MADSFEISDILNSLKNMFKGLFKGREAPKPSGEQPSRQFPQTSKGYQSPIRSPWKNSGDYSPGVATDPRHPKGHNGIDMRAPGGTAVYPMAPGIAINVGTDPKGGNVVSIDHENGIKTYYAHLRTVKINKGDRVNNDTVIGTVGDTGNAKGTWPHVHFQVWNNGQLTNPGNYFSVPRYQNVDAKNEQMWMPGAKEEAASWSMKDHKQQSRVAFSQDVETLCKIAKEFYKLSIDPRIYDRNIK